MLISKRRRLNVSKWSTRLLALALSGLVMAGCQTTRTVAITPECVVPPKPVLPLIESSQLETLNDTAYWSLMDRERRIVDWAHEMRATLKALCEDNDG